MKKIILIALAVLLSGAISAKALEYFRGTPEEIQKVRQADAQPADVAGYEAIDGNKVNTGGYFRENLLPLTNNTYDVGSSALKFRNGYFAGALNVDGNFTSAGNLLPDANNTRDIGSAALTWRSIFLGGTLNVSSSAFSGNLLPDLDNSRDIGSPTLRWNEINGYSVSSTLASVFSNLYVGTTATTTLTTGNRGLATSTFYSDLSVVSRDLVVGGGGSATGWLWVGNGVATTSIRGGDAGTATSTFQGDVSISNLYAGILTFDADAGMVDAMQIPVSNSATTGTLEGYNFLIDNTPLMSLTSRADALGGTWGGYVGIGTQTPSSTLHVGQDFMGINNAAGTSTIVVGTDRMTSGCIVFQNLNKNGWVGCYYSSGTSLTCGVITDPSICK